MSIEKFSIACTGYEIQADLHQGTDQRAILLMFVGFGSSKASNSAFADRVVEETNIDTVVVDLSGHGESPFDIDDTVPAQHLLEATKAYDWVKEHYPDRSIYLTGASYGGFIAAYSTRFRLVDKLILRTPAIYKPEDMYSAHRYIDKETISTYREDSEALCKHPLFMQPALGKPATLVVVHSKDESVPLQTTDVYTEVFAAQTYTAEGFKHAFRDASNPEAGITPYFAQIAEWLTL